MKRFGIILLFIVGMVLSFSEAIAQEERTSRKGFLIGFDVGGGGVHFARDGRKGGFMLGLKIGGGLNERILFLGEIAGPLTSSGSNPTLIQSLYFAPQFFVVKNFYLRPGVGIGSADERVAGGVERTESGFAAGLATGYEWRLAKKFALSPEGKFGYVRTEGRNYYFYGAVLDLRWYF